MNLVVTLLPSVVGVSGDDLAIPVTLRHVVSGGVEFRETDDVMSVILRHNNLGKGNGLCLPFPNHHSLPDNTPITTLSILSIRINFYSDDLCSGIEEDGSGEMLSDRIRFGLDNRGGSGGGGGGGSGRVKCCLFYWC